MTQSIFLKTIKIIISIFFIGAVTNCINAQKIYDLTLDSAIAIAKKQSHRMKMLQENLNESRYRLNAAFNRFRTKVNFNATIPNYQETYEQLSDSSGVRFFPVKQRLYSGSLEVSQPLITDGRIYLNAGGYNSDDFRNHDRIAQTTAGIGFEQPIQAFFIYNELRANYKRAKLNFELTNKQFKREELDLVYNISQSYYALTEAEKRLEIAFENLKRQEEAYKLAQNKYQAGLIREVEALQLEVDLGEATNQYDIAMSTYYERANYLKQELGLSLPDTIKTINSLEYKAISVDVELAVKYGLQNRSELGEREIQVNLSKLNIRQQKARGMVSGSISGYYNLIGMDRYPLSGDYYSTFNKTYKGMLDRPGNRGFMVNIRIPIIDWGENRSLVKAEEAILNSNLVNLDYTKISIEREIRNTVNNLNSSYKRLLLLEKNTRLAGQSLDISYLRFTNGDIDAEALALDRSRYNRTKLSYLEAFINYKMELLDLLRKTFYDFEKNKAVVE